MHAAHAAKDTTTRPQRQVVMARGVAAVRASCGTMGAGVLLLALLVAATAAAAANRKYRVGAFYYGVRLRNPLGRRCTLPPKACCSVETHLTPSCSESRTYGAGTTAQQL